MAPIEYQNEVHGRGLNLFITSLAMILAPLVAVSLRLMQRTAKKTMGLDDYFIVLAFFFNIGFTITNCLGERMRTLIVYLH